MTPLLLLESHATFSNLVYRFFSKVKAVTNFETIIMVNFSKENQLCTQHCLLMVTQLKANPNERKRFVKTGLKSISADEKVKGFILFLEQILSKI